MNEVVNQSKTLFLELLLLILEIFPLFCLIDYENIVNSFLHYFKKLLFEIILNTSLPIFMANGFPPKVDPCVPATIPDAAFLFISTAPIGKPPPMPFAIGTISGFTLDLSKAKKSPVLPIPH